MTFSPNVFSCQKIRYTNIVHPFFIRTGTIEETKPFFVKKRKIRTKKDFRAVLEKKSQSMFFMLVQSIAGVFFYETYKLLYPDSLKLWQNLEQIPNFPNYNWGTKKIIKTCSKCPFPNVVLPNSVSVNWIGKIMTRNIEEPFCFSLL